MKTSKLLTGFMLQAATVIFSQTKIDSLKDYVYLTDTQFENSLVTNRAFNLFSQKKTSYYLSGVSEINLSRYIATYNSDNDKFNFGVNFRNDDSDKKLKWLFSPLFESNIKKNFTTLYKNKEWQSDIRFGAKFTWFFGGKIMYSGMNYNSDQETNLIIVRNNELAKIIKKDISDATVSAERIKNSKAQIQRVIADLRNTAKQKLEDEKKGSKEDSIKDYTIYTNTIAYLDSLTINDNKKLDSLIIEESDKLPTLNDYKDQIASAEVNRLYKRNSYNWYKNHWISLWGFYPFKERKTFIASNSANNFESQKLNLWEVNLQGNTIWEFNNTISFYLSSTWKVFQNNSAIADLMTSVDYYKYSQFPQTNQSNLAVLENNKAYIGTYEEFITNTFSLQLVVSLSNTNDKGKEKLLTPGISASFEKNIGFYSATNLRFGIPLRFKGKSTPINIEPQIILRDVGNYANNSEYEVKPTIGINVGLPFIALFK